jgi:amidophosphoribosyltransferase
MSKLGDFVAFRAAIDLLKSGGQEHIIDEVYDAIQEMDKAGTLHTENMVRRIYKPFTTEEISMQIARRITPSDFSIPVEVLYQNIEDLHKSCPTNTGDWYFTGNYPTPGGNRVCNKAFLNFMSGKNVRGY